MELCNVQIRRHKGEAGQATVEFALLLPLFIACIALIAWSALLGLSSIRLSDTARVAARAASTAADPTLTVESLLENQEISHSESLDETRQFLTVTLRQKIRIPLLGIPLPALSISAQSTVLVEGQPMLTN